jgi:hypothetical protein
MDPRSCLVCGRFLAEGARPDAKYCQPSCRTKAYRKRSQQPEQSAPGQSPAAVEPKPCPVPAGPPAAAPLPQRRVAIEHQLTMQAPEGAVGYRLIIAPQRAGERPSLAPRKRLGEDRPFWALTPVHLPDDSRLQDGQKYRILWVRRDGTAVPPKPGSGLPMLHYFLGAPDSRGDALEDELNAMLAQTAGRPEHARLHAKLLAQRAERLDGLVQAERAQRDKLALEEAKRRMEEMRRQTTDMLQESAKLARKQRKREAKRAKRQGVDWSAWLPLFKAFISSMGDLGALYLKIRPAVAELRKEGKAPPLTLFLLLEFCKAMEAHLTQVPRREMAADKQAAQNRGSAVGTSVASGRQDAPTQTSVDPSRARPDTTSAWAPQSPTLASQHPEAPAVPVAATIGESTSTIGTTAVGQHPPYVANGLAALKKAIEDAASEAATKPAWVAAAEPSPPSADPGAEAGKSASADRSDSPSPWTFAPPSPTRLCETPPERPMAGAQTVLQSEAAPAVGPHVEPAAEARREDRSVQNELSVEPLPDVSTIDSPQAAGGLEERLAPQDPVVSPEPAPSSPALHAPKQPPISPLDEVVFQILQGLQEHHSVLLQVAELDPSMQELLETLQRSHPKGQAQSVPSA